MELYKVGEVGSWRLTASGALSLWHTEEAMQWTDGWSSAHPHCVDRESIACLLPLAVLSRSHEQNGVPSNSLS